MLRGSYGHGNPDHHMGIRALYQVKPRKYRSNTDIASQIGAELRVVYAAQLSQAMKELHGLHELLARLDTKVKNEGRE